VRAAEQHGKIQTLCGIKPDQEKADFRGQSLKPADAVLLAYDIKVNAPLTTLDIAVNSIGVEGAKAIAAVLVRWEGLRSFVADLFTVQLERVQRGAEKPNRERKSSS
jgi:hypothetical protein